MGAINSTRREIVLAAPSLLLGTVIDPIASFARPKDNLRFSVIGDWGRDGADFQTEVAGAMKQVTRTMGSEFVVSTGDNFYQLGVGSSRDRKWESSFEQIYDESLGKWFIVLGNHDWGGKISAQIDRTHRSDRWVLPELWHDHWIMRGGLPKVHLIFIDTVTWIGSEGWFWSRLGDSPTAAMQQRQRDWLQKKLAEPAELKLVFGHHPIFSIGPHGGERRMAQLDDLLHLHSTTAYVCGHDHCLYHITHRGMHYICSGAGSQMLATYKGGSSAGCVLRRDCSNEEAPKWHAFFSSVPNPNYRLEGGFAHFEIGSEQADFSFFDGKANRRYRAPIKRFRRHVTPAQY